MTTFPGSPRLLKGGIVLVDPETAAVRRIISLQYNPDTLTRSLQIQGVTVDGGGDRSEVLRLKGPPVETIKLDAEIDATDQLEFPDQNPNAVEAGIQPQLAALEAIVYPTSEQLQSNNALAQIGHARDHSDAVIADAFYLEQEPDHSGAADGFQHHGGSVRSRAQSDPGQGKSRDAGVECERCRVRSRRRQSVYDLSAAKRKARRARAGRTFPNFGIKGID